MKQNFILFFMDGWQSPSEIDSKNKSKQQGIHYSVTNVKQLELQIYSAAKYKCHLN